MTFYHLVLSSSVPSRLTYEWKLEKYTTYVFITVNMVNVYWYKSLKIKKVKMNVGI